MVDEVLAESGGGEVRGPTVGGVGGGCELL